MLRREICILFVFISADGTKLLLPSFLKDLVSDHTIYTFSRLYDYSIIPSAPNDLFQAFFIFGIFFHCLAIVIACRLYMSAQSAYISEEKSAIYFIFKSYIVSVLCVLFTRGPIDLLIFSILPVYAFIKIFTFFITPIQLKPRPALNLKLVDSLKNSPPVWRNGRGSRETM